MKQSSHILEEILAGQRFQFGMNWERFLHYLDESQIIKAEQSLKLMLESESLSGKCFLDVGSGSGLFSLAARRLGANVHSFDYDPKSVACTNELKRRYFCDDSQWIVETGSILDLNYLQQLEQFDIVYSWGVLHHTGAMHDALKNVSSLVKVGGKLFIAIYNDQGWLSRYWKWVKKMYNFTLFTRLVVWLFYFHYFGMIFLVKTMTGRIDPQRGMSFWHDVIDWLGGYPFEVAKPEDIFMFYRQQKFNLIKLKTCGGKLGCNEFVFEKLQ